MLSTIQSYRQLTQDLTRTLDSTAAQAYVNRESKYYIDNIEQVKSIDSFVNNRRIFSFAMKAFGLEDMTYAKAMVRKALVEGVESRDSFANRLVDTRLKEFVTAFNFARRGEYTTTFSEVKQGTVDRFVRQTLEEQEGQKNEGVRLALYFQRKAAGINGPLAILADKALLQVVQTALDIPLSSSSQSIDKQVAIIAKKLPIGTLKDPEKLSRFIEKFTLKWELANPASSVPIQTLAGNTNSATGISASVLTALQTLKIGGG